MCLSSYFAVSPRYPREKGGPQWAKKTIFTDPESGFWGIGLEVFLTEERIRNIITTVIVLRGDSLAKEANDDKRSHDRWRLPVDTGAGL